MPAFLFNNKQSIIQRTDVGVGVASITTTLEIEINVVVTMISSCWAPLIINSTFARIRAWSDIRDRLFIPYIVIKQDSI